MLTWLPACADQGQAALSAQMVLPVDTPRMPVTPRSPGQHGPAGRAHGRHQPSCLTFCQPCKPARPRIYPCTDSQEHPQVLQHPAGVHAQELICLYQFKGMQVMLPKICARLMGLTATVPQSHTYAVSASATVVSPAWGCRGQGCPLEAASRTRAQWYGVCRGCTTHPWKRPNAAGVRRAWTPRCAWQPPPSMPTCLT